MFVNYNAMFMRWDRPLVTYSKQDAIFDPLFFEEIKTKQYQFNFDFSLLTYPLWIVATNRMVNPTHLDNLVEQQNVARSVQKGGKLTLSTAPQILQDLRLLKTHNQLSRGFLAYLAFSTLSHTNTRTSLDVMLETNLPMGLVPSPIERFLNYEMKEYMLFKTIKYPLLNALLIYCRAKQSLTTSETFSYQNFKNIEFDSSKYTLG